VSAAPAPASQPLDGQPRLAPRDEPRAYVLDDPLDFSGRDAGYFVIPRTVLEDWRASRRRSADD
jgi:hypothetical protein